jgi:diacylglycerol kinase (ATP)
MNERALAPAKNQSFLIRLRFALSGIRSALQSEHSLRVHVVAAVLVLIALLVLRPAPVWWALAGLAVSAVIGAELFNTALERLVDHLHPDVHAQIRVVKDCAAAAVLVVVAGALCVAAAFVINMLA